MLKGECNHISDALDGIREAIPWKAFTDDKLDATKVVSRAPKALLQ